MRGLLIDPMTNSMNLYYKNCTGRSKENFLQGLGTERVEMIPKSMKLIYFCETCHYH